MLPLYIHINKFSDALHYEWCFTLQFNLPQSYSLLLFRCDGVMNGTYSCQPQSCSVSFELKCFVIHMKILKKLYFVIFHVLKQVMKFTQFFSTRFHLYRLFFYFWPFWWFERFNSVLEKTDLKAL
jgi:hypothetical protein